MKIFDPIIIIIEIRLVIVIYVPTIGEVSTALCQNPEHTLAIYTGVRSQ